MKQTPKASPVDAPQTRKVIGIRALDGFPPRNPPRNPPAHLIRENPSAAGQEIPANKQSLKNLPSADCATVSHLVTKHSRTGTAGAAKPRRKQEVHMRALGTRLHKVRRDREMTQDELAKAVDVTRRHIQNLEAGRANPSHELLLRLAAALNISLKDLLDLDGPIPPPREKEPKPLADIRRAFKKKAGASDERRRAQALLEEPIPPPKPLNPKLGGGGS
jgi:transcriptional regulator with XRE-family HTH domain